MTANLSSLFLICCFVNSQTLSRTVLRVGFQVDQVDFIDFTVKPSPAKTLLHKGRGDMVMAAANLNLNANKNAFLPDKEINGRKAGRIWNIRRGVMNGPQRRQVMAHESGDVVWQD
jgi:hypothetical protein